MTSSPSPSASATKAIMRTMAARTRIWRSSPVGEAGPPTRRERSAVRTTTKVTSSSPTNTLSSTAVEPGPLSPEKKSDNRMTAPKSATEAAASMSCPNFVLCSPTSASTGMITPREVADRMIATSRGMLTNPASFSP
jgi:hypothetical protein